MSADPREGGVHPAAQGMSKTQRLVAVIGTAVMLLAMTITHFVLMIISIKAGQWDRAAVFATCVVVGVVLAFTVDHPH